MPALLAPSGECLRGKGLVWLIGAVVCSLACRGSKTRYIRIPGFSFLAITTALTETFHETVGHGCLELQLTLPQSHSRDVQCDPVVMSSSHQV